MMSLLRVNAIIGQSLADAEYHIGADDEAEEVTVWMQSWPSTACGHGGVAGQAFTSGVVVGVTTAKGRVLFYSQGRLLHDREHDRKSEWAISRRQIPPKGGGWQTPP